jgi:hypothetical protein
VLDSHAILLGHVDRTKTAHLGCQNLALLSSNGAAQNCLVSIEVLANLLKRSVAGFDVELPDDEELEGEPAAVDDVVLPLDGLEGNGVDVVVEEESEIDAQEHDSHTLGTDVVRQNLNRVSDQETREGDVVEDVVDEDESHDRVCSSVSCSNLEAGRTDSLDNESAHHTSGRDQEKSATADLVDKETLSDSDDHVDNLQDAVDDKLSVGVGDANLVENESEVVRNQAVS